MSIFEAIPLSLVRSAALLFASAFGLFACRALHAVTPLAEPAFGDVRYRPRLRARSDATFSALEPALLRLGGIVRRFVPADVHARLERMLMHAGLPLGLCAEELIVTCFASAAFVGSLLVFAVHQADLHGAYAVYGAAIAPLLPVFRVHAAVKQRAKELDRSLPSAIDLCVLCMSAGCDFPFALELVVTDLGAAHRVCRDELRRVLDDLAFGATRGSALALLATRSQSRGVAEFVAAVRLADQKGTPLIDTLVIQAASLRQRRSVRAEELAAQAGVKMMAPMLLLVATVMLIVFGPFIVTGAGL